MMNDDTKLVNPLWPYRAADIETVTGLKYNAIRLAISRAEAAIPGFDVRPTARPSAIMMVQLALYGQLVGLGLSALQATYVALHEKLALEIERDIEKRYPENAEKTIRENQKAALYDLEADCFLIVSQPQLLVGDVLLSDFAVLTERKLNLLYQRHDTTTMYHGTPFGKFEDAGGQDCRDIAERTQWFEPEEGKDHWGALPVGQRDPLAAAVRLVNLTRLIRSTATKLMDLYPESAVRLHTFFVGRK